MQVLLKAAILAIVLCGIWIIHKLVNMHAPVVKKDAFCKEFDKWHDECTEARKEKNT